MHVVTVLFRIKANSQGRFLDLVSAQARTSLESEFGCVQFDVCVSRSDPTRIFLYEIYADAEAFRLHLQTSHFASFEAAARPEVIEKVVQEWSRFDDR